MHITKNMCANTLNTLMDTGGTSKDSLATRLDMQHLGIRKELHPVELEKSPDGLLCEPEEASEHERTQVQLWPYEGT